MDNQTTAKAIIQGICTNVFPILDEKQRRLLAGCMAEYYGRGGQSIVSECSGLSRNTVSKGMDELETRQVETRVGKVRSGTAGRIPTITKHPEILSFIDNLLQESTYGDPMRVILYTTLSLRKIADKVREELGITVSRNIVSNIIQSLGYSKQKNQKMEQLGSRHPDRDEQFRHINETGKSYMAKGDPFISIDCKKKENIGNFANRGREYRHAGDPRLVLDHDFPLKELGKASPYGVYVVNNNEAFVNLGISKDTAEFAVASIRAWWYDIGIQTFPDAKRIYISADGGGSNGSRSRLWKLELARLAEETGLEIEVSHFPPGTSKWNKVEHRLFAYITKNWEGKPLINIETIISLIGNTTTKKGLKVKCVLDERSYETGIKVSEEDFDAIDIQYLGPNETWNYIIKGFVH